MTTMTQPQVGHGRIVQVGVEDSVRIANPTPGARAIQIPVALIVAIDRVLRHCAMTDDPLAVELSQDEVTGATCWRADLACYVYGEVAGSPWGAVVGLAEELGRG